MHKNGKNPPKLLTHHIVLKIISNCKFLGQANCKFQAKCLGIFHIIEQIKVRSTIVNRTLLSVHGGLLEIMHTVPFRYANLHAKFWFLHEV